MTIQRSGFWVVLRAAVMMALGLVVSGVTSAYADDQSPTGTVKPDTVRQVRLAGPPATVSFPLAQLVESQPLAEQGIEFGFTLWRDPDQLRALTLKQDADLLAMPSNVAANLYNRGVPLRLLNVAEWGMLKILSSQPGAASLTDLVGQEIAVPFRADMPDILFQLLAREQDLNPKKDFTLRYVASPMDAAQLLMSGKVKHALIAEPAASQVLVKSHSFPAKVFAPDITVSVDLQQEWGRVLKRNPEIPQAGLTVLGDTAQDTAWLAQLNQAYTEAAQWCHEHATECAKAVVKHIPMLEAKGVEYAITQRAAHVVPAADAREPLEYFYQRLLDSQPQLIGGKLPDAAFYGSPTASVQP